MNFFKLLAIISLISGWLKKALEDGRITLKEALELIGLLGKELDLPLDFDVSGVLGEPSEEAATAPGEDAAAELLKPDEIKS